ncbi:PLA2G7, partial [Symbiodinium necroappetens]
AVSQNSFVGESLVIQGSLRSQDLEKQNRTNGLVAGGADGFVNHLLFVDYQADSSSYYRTEGFFEDKTSFFEYETNGFFEYKTSFFVDETNSFFEYKTDGFVEHSVYYILAGLVETMSSSTAPTMSSKNENDNYYQDEDASVPPSEQTSWGSSWWTDDGWEDGYDEPSWYEYDETGHEDYYDGEEEYWPEEGEGDPADDHHRADWSYPVKGGKGKRPKGNAMGVGCSVCGSKWHHATSCPVGGKAGKGGFGSKGHEKGNKGGYGKGFRRPWTPKGKGYGKWSPWSSKGSKGKSKGKSKWRGYAEYPDDYNHEKNLAAHFGTDTFAAFPSRSSLRPEVFKMDKDDPEFLGKKSRVTFEDRPDDAEDAQDQNHNNQSSKNLAFNFPVTLYADREHFHMIEGHKRRGLLVDPGASNGLIGSETLRDIVDTCLPEKEKKMIQWSSKVANVSGISGAKDQGTFTADVLGGEGSLCPALLSNPALRKMSSVIYSNFFDNGDGLLACHPRGGEPQGQDVTWSHFRLLLTDSGHYLLPVDRGPNMVSDEAKAKATTFLQSSVDVARKKWKDVRHFFFGARNAELERSEVFFEANEEAKMQEHSVRRDSAEVPEHSVPQVDVNDAAGGQDMSPSRTRHASVRGLFLLSADDPMQTWRAVDEWTLFGNVLVRHHHRPRRALFTPGCTKDCPVSSQLLSGRRETTWCCDGVTKVFKDSWTKANHPHRDLGQLWTGQTKFYLRDEATSPKTVSSIADETGEMPWEDFGEYQKDCFPEHWTSVEVKRHERRYGLLEARQGLRFGIEQPLNSTMFTCKNSPLYDIYDIPGTRKRQQVDQCFHGCANDQGQPIRKATAIVSNVKHYKTAKRCNGHRGRGHVAQGSPALGVNFASKSLVYPRRMCHALVDDVWKSLRSSEVQVKQWPSELLLHANFSGYKCERCQLGRAALPFMEHSLIPGECRHAQRPPGKRRQPLRPADPLSTFKRKAREKDLEGIVLETPADIFLPVQASLYLKYTLLMMVQDSVALFTEAVERQLDYVHWVTDPVHKTMFQEIFQKEMNVKGVACALRPFHCMVPEPKLSSKTSPLRLQIRGDVKRWQIMELEDFRLLSHSQQHQPIEEINWLVTLFGSDPEEKDPSAKVAADEEPGAIPATPTKASHRSKASSSKDVLPEPASKDKVPDDPEEVEEIEETFEGAPQKELKPLYSFKKVFKRLIQIAETATSFAVLPDAVQEAVQQLRKRAEAQRPYKVSIVGWVMDRADGQQVWRRASSSFPQYEEIMEYATLVARHFSDRPFGGVAIGQGVRHLRPPPHSIGVLLLWAQGSEQYASQEHWSSTTLKIKDMVPFPVEDACFVYLFYYNHVGEEVRSMAVKEPSDVIPTVPMELDSLEPAMDTSDLIDHKRKGPETRTVIIGQESKKQRTDSLDSLVLKTLNSEDYDIDYLHQLYWLASRHRKFNLGVQPQLSSACNMALFSLLARIEHLRHANRIVQKAKHPDHLDLGLHYRFLGGKLRLLCIHDASSANKDRNYAQEGILVLLCEDNFFVGKDVYKVEASDSLTANLGGKDTILEKDDTLLENFFLLLFVGYLSDLYVYDISYYDLDFFVFDVNMVTAAYMVFVNYYEFFDLGDYGRDRTRLDESTAKIARLERRI